MESQAQAVLVISQFHEDHEFLSRVLSGKSVASAKSLAEARQHLQANEVAVILCEATLPDGGWKDLLQEAKRRPTNQPEMIVFSRMADEALWAEVINAGGLDVLMKPFDRLEVLRAVGIAFQRVQLQRQQAGQK